MVSSFLVTLIPYAAKVFEDSKSYLGQMNRNLNRKMDKRVVNSLRPLMIKVGPFDRIMKKLLAETIKNSTDAMVTLLIAF